MRDNIYVGLVHYPVYNRNNDVVATSVTNFDIHDISRTCRTYDIKKYFIITPVDAQKELTARMSLQRSSGTIADFAAHGNYLERLHLEREKQLTALTQAEIRIEEMRKHYIKAHQERLIVTKLKDKKQAYWKKDMQRQQDILLDDIINAQEYRKRTL